MNLRHSKRTLACLSALFLATPCGLFVTQCKRFDVTRQIIVKTGEVSDITFNACVATGNLLDLGESGVNQHGFAWSTSPDPDNVGEQCILLGEKSETGGFEGTVTGLAPETEYYLWAFASDGSQRIHGDPVTFTTSQIPGDPPEVQTGNFVNIVPNAAEVEYNVMSDGGLPVIERGVCWNMEPEPTIDHARTNDGSGTGEYTTVLEGLSPATRYFIRAYAVNIAGVGYGDQKEFSTPNEFGELQDGRDGKVYATIQIGDQNWMAQNLNIGEMIEGIIEMTDDGIIQKYCYENDPVNGDVFGGLYTWGEMINYNLESTQGICPEGWHIPSEEEWRQLEFHLGMSEDDLQLQGWRGEGIGNLLKVHGNEFWNEPNNGANNGSGFSARGAGLGNGNGEFWVLRVYTGFWTSHPDMWSRGLSNTENGIERIWRQPGDRLSVRCVQD
jgi:uncharacterized protein (TIGR02145 family)